MHQPQLETSPSFSKQAQSSKQSKFNVSLYISVRNFGETAGKWRTGKWAHTLHSLVKTKQPSSQSPIFTLTNGSKRNTEQTDPTSVPCLDKRVRSFQGHLKCSQSRLIVIEVPVHPPFPKGRAVTDLNLLEKLYFLISLSHNTRSFSSNIFICNVLLD